MTTKIKEAGFSLIEIIIVMAIISIVALSIAVNIGINNSKRQAKKSAEKLEELIKFAQNQAILRQSNYGLLTYQDGYLFLKKQGNSDWMVINEPQILKREYLPNGVRFKLNFRQIQLRKKDDLQPEIFIYADGYTDKFDIVFYSQDDEKLITLSNSAQSKMSIHE